MTSPVFLLKRESVLSLVIASVVQVMSQNALAAPEGGQVVAGQAVIEQVEKETRIQQASERLSIDWKNFDINSDERVQFIQPNSSSIAFNRILSNKGSLIQGRIDANGQVVLINPNGLIFTEGASVNAGGLIASALQMNDQDYLNGKFTLNALEGSEGRVINSGLLNAATGGNISLLGQSVENKGLISAQLGSVNLAAGKEAVLTFEPNGLVGVRVTEAVLQKDLGVDAAVINSGEIKAEGGKVLITASTSKDIFSQAVNAGELSSAKSALVNADGSFTLGAGADINNTGVISVAAERKAGEAVIIGENITNEGVITADSQTAKAGSIEISAKNINETKGNGKVTAVAHASGQGGDIKLLGDKVGVLDLAQIDASGANGGGQVLLGGDKTGANVSIHNAEFLYVGEQAQIRTDATQAGEGGRLIAFAEDTTRIYGSLSARGGTDGHGGFIETSGLKGFDLYRAPDVSSVSGIGGHWLIDPSNITINTNSGADVDEFVTESSKYTAIGSGISLIGWSTLLSGAPATVQVITTDGDITFQNGYYFSVGGTKNTSITFDAKGDIKFNAGLVVDSSKASGQPNANASDESLSLTFNAGGVIDFNNTQFHTNGGSFTAKATTGNITSTGTIKTERPTTALDGATQSGAISITADAGQAAFNNISSAGFSFTSGEGDGGNAGSLNITAKQGVIITGSVSSAGGLGKDDISANGVSTPKTGGHANSLTINSSDGPINIVKLSADGGTAGFDTIIGGNNDRRDAAAGGNAGQVTLTASQGDINLTDTASNKFGTGTKDLGTTINPDNGKNGNGAGFTFTAKNITTKAIATNANEATFEASETVNLGNLNTALAKSDCGDGLCRGDVLIKTATGDSGIAVGQTAAWTIRGNTQLSLGTEGSVSLTTGANQFSGAGKNLSITAKDATLASNFALVLKNIAVENLNFFSALDISQDAAGSIVATNSARLNGKTVVLNNSGNNFNQIDSLSATDNAEIADSDTLTINSLSTPKLAITSTGTANLNGDINAQNRSVEITQKGAGSVAITGSATKSGAGDITVKTTGSGIGLSYSGSETATWDLNAKSLTTNNSTRFIYDGFATLIGGTGNDIFNVGALITPPNISGGSSGTDELHIDENNNAANNWNVAVVKAAQEFTAAQNGLLQVTGLDKIQVQNVNGSATPQLTLVDDGITTWTLTSTSNEFRLQNTNLGGGIVFSGFKQLNGGTGQDVFDYTGAGNTVFIGGLDGGNASAAEDKILGFNADTSWDLIGAQANFYRTSLPAEKVSFKNIDTLVGGNQKDVITLSNTIDAVNLSSFSAGFTLENFEGITATATNAKLTGYAGNSNWTVTDDKKGTITSGGRTTEFSGFNELISAEFQADGTTVNTDTFAIDLTGAIGKITGQAGDILNVRSGNAVANNWVINSDGSAQVGQQNGNTNNVYVGTITGVGTVNGSTGADNFTAQGTYTNGTIKAGFSADVEDKNTLSTAAADIVFNNADYTSNGILGINEFKASGTTAVLKVSSLLGAVNWQVTPGASANQLSGNVSDVTSNKSLTFENFATLNGGDNSDTFSLGAGAFNGGAIDAGIGDNRLINTTTNTAWNLNTNKLRSVNFANIQKLTAFDGDTLTAANANNTFTIGVGGVQLFNEETNTTYTLVDFKSLTGGDKVDRFNLNISAADTALKGGLGNDEFTLANDTIKTGVINGGDGTDTLKVTAGDNDWTLTAVQTGDVNTNTFNAIEVLAGGSGADTLDNKVASQTLSLTAVDSGVLHDTADATKISATLSGFNSINGLAVLKGFNGTQTWNLLTNTTGTIKDAADTTLNFGQTASVLGGSGNDTFIIAPTLTQFTLDAGTGLNTLQGANIDNAWAVSAQTAGAANEPLANTGTLNGTGNFTGVQQFKGGTAKDDLDLTGSTGLIISLATISGFETLLGGTDSQLIGANQTNNWQLIKGSIGTVNGIGFDGFSTLTGGTGRDIFAIANTAQFTGDINGGINSAANVRDEIRIDGVAGDYTVTTQGSGSLAYVNTTNSVLTKINFDEIETLVGGLAADKFTVNADVNMLLDGGSGSAIDTINLPATDLDIALAVGTAVSGINSLTLANFESIAADLASKSILRAIDGEATWDINGENAGLLTLKANNVTSTTRFSGFVNLVGGSGIDTFNFNAADSTGVVQGSFTGKLTGGAGDKLIARDAPNEWTLNTAADTKNSVKAKGGAIYVADFTGLTVLQGGSQQDQFIINGNHSDLSVFGGEGDDIFTLNDGAIVKSLQGEEGKNTLEGRKTGLLTWDLLSATGGTVKDGALVIATFSGIQAYVGRSAASVPEATPSGDVVNYFSAANGPVKKTWEFNSNQFKVVEDAITLAGMDSVTAGADTDTVLFKSAFKGTFNAGGGNDVLEIGSGSITVFEGGTGTDSIKGPVSGALWELSSDTNTVTSADGKKWVEDFHGVELLEGNATADDTLTSSLADNSWRLKTAQSGSINTINFTGFDYLVGSELKDQFIFDFVGEFGKGVDAGLGDNSVQLTTVTSVELDWTDKLVNGVKGTNRITGSNSADSELILVSPIALTWSIDRLDGGSISEGAAGDPANTFNFDQFKNIIGSDNVDTVIFTNAGRISGKLDGGVGNDSLQGLNRENTWQLGQAISVNAMGDQSAYISNALGFEQLIGGTGKDTFILTAKVNAAVNGKEGDDRLVLTTGGQLKGGFNGDKDINTIESQLAASRWDLTTPVNGLVSAGEEAVVKFTGANQWIAKPLIPAQAGDNSINLSQSKAALVWAISAGTGENATGQVELSGEAASRSNFSGFNRIVGSKGADEITLATALASLDLSDGDNRLLLNSGAKITQLSAGAGKDEIKSFTAANVWQINNATEGKLSTASADVIGQFSGFELLTGSGSDRLIGATDTNKWIITGPSSGTLNNVFSFSAFGRLQGNSGNDTFEFGAAGTIAGIEGGEGEDNLLARDGINQWNFSADDRGTIHAPNEVNYVNFNGVESFTGALTASDIVQLDPQVTSVKLNAGGHADDELIISYRDTLTVASDGASWFGISGLKKVTAQALTVNRSAQLSSTASAPSRWTINAENGGDWNTGTSTIHFSGFDKLLGSATADEFILAGGRISTLIDGGNQVDAAQNDSLATENKFTYWTITNSGAGSLTYFDINNPPVQKFAGIETLLGNASNDEFRLLTDGITINIRGGNSTGVDKVFFNGALDITLGQQDVVGVGIAEIEFFNANSNTQNTLHSSSAGGVWTLTGENSGRLTSGTETLDFSNFQNLLGGKGDDLFDLDEKARVTGVLSGGEGNNSLTVHHNRDLTATLTADGAGDITAAQAIARFDAINSLRVMPVGGGSHSATLTAANLANGWVLTDDKVVLNKFNYSGFTILNGNESADNFVLSGKQTLSINGKGGNDSLTVKSKKDTQVTWQLVNVNGRIDISNGGTVETSLPIFSNFEQLIGGDGNDAFVLSTSNTGYTLFDGGAGINSLAATGANNQWQLGALTSDDSAVVDHLNAAEVVRMQSLKGAGNDALIGSDNDTLWQLARGGDVNLTQTADTQNRAIVASGIGRIKGGKAQDDFVLQESGTGSFARMDGGEVGTDISTGVNTSSVRDSLTATALTSDVQVRLDAIASSASVGANQLVVAGIENIELNAANNNSLFGPTLADKQAINWQIAQQKQGSFAPKTGSNSENTVAFSGVKNIIAGGGEDRFVLASLDAIGGELSGELDGGEGTDFIDYSQAALVANQSAFDVAIGESARLKNIEGVIGKNNSSMRLVIKSTSSQWLLDDIDGAGTTSDGVNDGRVTLATGKTVDFIDFASLVGTQGSDMFDIKGSLNGAITTGDGVDAIAVSVSANRAQAITLNNDSTDTLRLDWAGVAPANVKETYKQSANGRESITLEGPSLQPFAIDFTALGSINDRLAVEEMRVQTAFETAGSNRVSLAQNALQLAIDNAGTVKTGTWFNVENKTNLVLTGQTGDQLNLSGKTQLAGALTLEKFTINSLGGANTALGAQNLAAGQINFNSVAGIGSELAPLVITTPQVQFNNLRGDAWVKSTSDIKLASLDGQGKLTLNADGIIGQTQLLTYAKDLSLKASGGITLDNPDNRLTGELTLESAHNIVLANGLTQVNTVTAENLKITGQDLTFNGPMVVAGTTDLTSTGSINALNTGNHLARVQLNSAGAVKLMAGTDSSLAATKVGGALQVQADGLDVVGDITAASLDLNANTNATSGRGQLKVSGQLNAQDIKLSATDIVLKTQLQGGELSLNAQSVTLEKPINLLGNFTADVDTLLQSAEAAINAKGAIDINASGALQLNGALSSQQNLQITADGAIAQGGAWTTTSEGSSAGGADIVVKSGGTISMEPAATTQSTGAITYDAAGTVKLSALTAKGEVAINTKGSIEDINDLAVNITAPSARLTSAGDIRGLNLAVDSLVGQFAGIATTVNLRNEKTLRIDRLVGDGTITVAAARGDIVFNNDAVKNPEMADLYAQTDLPRENTGVVNSNFNTGTLNILAEKGRVKATGPVNVNQPDLVANTINIFSALGVSTPGRPLVIYSNTVLYTGTGLNWKPFTAFGHRFTFTSDNALDLSQLLLAAGDQLIEVEPLEDVNPAVFTDVRNYSADNISIMLPADQRYEE